MDIYFFRKARQINRKSLTARKVKRIEEQLDKLFDIFSCCRKLLVLRCEDFAEK